MPRTRGHAAKGERCYGVHDWNAKGRTNAIGAIAHSVFLTLGLFESTINSDVFYAWLTRDLLPKVPAGAVIVMANASFHKRQDMVTAINHAGCVLEFLPPYSPDLNPIELAHYNLSYFICTENKVSTSQRSRFRMAFA